MVFLLGVPVEQQEAQPITISHTSSYSSSASIFLQTSYPTALPTQSQNIHQNVQNDWEWCAVTFLRDLPSVFFYETS